MSIFLVEHSLEHVHMQGIRQYTHADRQQVIEELFPLIQWKFGDNLVAVAASASFARGEDSDYSDLELIAFVEWMPADVQRGGMGRIRAGMLVELVWMTRAAYLATTCDVTGDWYIAGSDRLLPLINAPFIEELNGYQVDRLREKCRDQARAFELKPASFTALLDTIVQGSYQDHTALRATVVDVFSQFEAIFETLGVELYDSDIDPN